jgi:hypothetical protein
LRGLALAAVLVSSCDLPLVSMAWVAFHDLLGAVPEVDVIRAAMAGVALLLSAAAVFLAGCGGLWVAAQVGVIVLGPLLGAVALAWYSRARGRDGSAAAGLLLAVVADACVLWMGRKGLPFDWTWFVPIGAAATVGFSEAVTRLRRRFSGRAGKALAGA